jgi:hypothetical protein
MSDFGIFGDSEKNQGLTGLYLFLQTRSGMWRTLVVQK